MDTPNKEKKNILAEGIQKVKDFGQRVVNNLKLDAELRKIEYIIADQIERTSMQRKKGDNIDWAFSLREWESVIFDLNGAYTQTIQKKVAELLLQLRVDNESKIACKKSENGIDLEYNRHKFSESTGLEKETNLFRFLICSFNDRVYKTLFEKIGTLPTIEKESLSIAA